MRAIKSFRRIFPGFHTPLLIGSWKHKLLMCRRVKPKALHPPPVSAVQGYANPQTCVPQQGRVNVCTWPRLQFQVPQGWTCSFPIMKYSDSVLLSSLKLLLIGCGTPTQEKQLKLTQPEDNHLNDSKARHAALL